MLPTWNINAAIKELRRLCIKIRSLMHSPLLRLPTRESSSPDCWSVLNPYKDPKERSVPSQISTHDCGVPKLRCCFWAPKCSPHVLYFGYSEEEARILNLEFNLQSFTDRTVIFCVFALFWKWKGLKVDASWLMIQFSDIAINISFLIWKTLGQLSIPLFTSLTAVLLHLSC